MKIRLLIQTVCLFLFSAPVLAQNYLVSQTDRLENLVIKPINFKGLSPEVYELAYKAHARAINDKKTQSPVLAVVDFSLPSNQKRLWVVDLNKKKVIFKDFVSHGRDANGKESLMANYFSNMPNSNASSLGVFVAGKAYEGKHGLSLRLKGLEKNINNNAEYRSIVVHGAPYVSRYFMMKNGRLGCSYGCFSVRPNVSSRLIKHLPEGSVLLAYYPDENWLKNSSYINN